MSVDSGQRNKAILEFRVVLEVSLLTYISSFLRYKIQSYGTYRDWKTFPGPLGLVPTHTFDPARCIVGDIGM